MSPSVSVKLRGRVTLRVGGKGVSLTNDVSSDFALALAKAILVGTGPAGAYTSGFSLPSGVVIVLLNNSSVVATIQANISKFSDSMQNNGELTSVTFVGSDATPSQYTFNSLELYTVVGNVLYMKVAYVNLPSPVTKNQNDIVEVTWVEEVLSSGPFYMFESQGLACSNCTSTCNYSLISQYPTKALVPNIIWSLMLIPGLNKVVQKVSCPIAPYVSQYYNAYLASGSPPEISGVTSVVLTDQCLNVLATVQVQSPIVTFSVSEDKAVVAMAMFITPSQPPYYAFPVFTVQGLFSLWLAQVQVYNPSGVSAGQLSVVVEVPYGKPTLEALNVGE